MSEEGISTDPLKVNAVKEWPQPKSATEVRQFVGLASYYRKFIPNFATVCKPLHRLTEKTTKFAWTEQSQDAFETIKQLLISAPILSYPLLQGQPYLLDCDASNVGVGAVLSQIQNGEEKVISYFSKCLSRSERQYCTTRKELLAVVIAVKHFHHYLFGQNFTVRTDHGSLQWLMRFKNCEGQIARWIETLSTYTFSIVHRAGRVHNNADSLSRRPCHNHKCKHCDRYEKKHLPDKLTESNKSIDESAVLRVASNGGNLNGDEKVTKLITGQDNKVGRPNDGNGSYIVQPGDGTVQKNNLCDVQYENPEHHGPTYNDDQFSGRHAQPTTYLGPRVAEVLSPEMSHGMSQIGVPHFTHATLNSVCDGVDAKTHKIFNSRHIHCCCKIAAHSTEDWLDNFESESLFGCLFENEDLQVRQCVAHAGVATEVKATSDKPWCPCEHMCTSTNTTNPDSSQNHLGCVNSTCNINVCMNTSQQLGGSGQSTSSCDETEKCCDLTQENIQ
ncbi:MAG: Ty3/Gypsy family RNase HI domain-containing protein, partial [Candidatus Thiodiazotropha taylori]|nr:Ty3/Gypsy family RNase HI domain-containing protein [Candidatus Thiodiazotropha taylori]MCW4310342.1 Ty3/Gypsy family RNase HI domain-containing protein [Candidatus Thiodiazotropha endolucinida]